MKRMMLLTLTVVCFITFTMSPVQAAGSDIEQDAIKLQLANHSYIKNTTVPDELRSMKASYEGTYERLIAGAKGDLKQHLMDQRDRVTKLFDQRIKAVEQGEKRQRRTRGPRGFFRGLRNVLHTTGRYLRRAGAWTGRTIGKGIKDAGDAVIRMIPRNPEDAIKFVIEHGGGGFSFARIIKRVAVSAFKRSAEGRAFAELARITKDPKLLDDFVKLDRASGGKLKIDPNFVERYKAYLSEQNKQKDDTASNDEPDSQDGESDVPVGYEGEGGYDDEENGQEADSFQAIYESYFDYNAYPLKLEGTMSLESYEVRVPNEGVIRDYVYDEDYPDDLAEDAAEAIAFSTEYYDVCQSMVGFYKGKVQSMEAQWGHVMPDMDSSEAVLCMVLTNDQAEHELFKYQRWALVDAVNLSIIGTPQEGRIDYQDPNFPSNIVTLFYETMAMVDEDGFLYIEGTTAVVNHVSAIYIEDIGDWGGKFILYEVDALLNFDLKSTEPLRPFTEEEIELLEEMKPNQ